MTWDRRTYLLDRLFRPLNWVTGVYIVGDAIGFGTDQRIVPLKLADKFVRADGHKGYVYLTHRDFPNKREGHK